jgi:hypothetical protein
VRILLFVAALAAIASPAGAQVRFPEQSPPPALPLDAAPAEPRLPDGTFGSDRPEQLLRRIQEFLFPGDFRFMAHGYFRAPLRIGVRERSSPMPDQAKRDVRAPWLVDDDYFRSGFAYTRLSESDWAELYLSAGNKRLVGTVALMGSLFSDWAKPLIDRQLGIAQAYVTLRWDWLVRGRRLGLTIKGGSFWDRFGWQRYYDTYLYGRTHQLGAQARLDLVGHRLSAWLLVGSGAHLDAVESNQGFTLLNYLHAGAGWRDLVQAGFYFVDTRANDQRQLKEIKDASMWVVGLDARVSHPASGELYVAASFLRAQSATYLAPAIEVMHAYGGRGITENYLGTDRSENGTGALWNLAFEYRYSAARLLRRFWPDRALKLRGGDVTLAFFGMATYAQSKQGDPDPAINRDKRTYFKWGLEAGWVALSWLAIYLRYDRVILDMNDDANTFRVLSPRLALRTHWLTDVEIFLQYSRYFYGERVQLRPGQIPLETKPDENVIKLQAQIVF